MYYKTRQQIVGAQTFRISELLLCSCAGFGCESGEPTTTNFLQLGWCATGTSPACAGFRQRLFRPSAERGMANAGDLPKKKG